MANTILLKGRGIRKEAVAAGTITPGDLVMIDSAGKLVRHNAASKKAAPLFAVENDLIGDTIDDDYAANDYVQAEYLTSGMEVLGLLAVNAAAVVIGAPLESDGAGGLRVIQDFTDAEIDEIGGQPVAIALEAVDNSAGATRVRIKAVII